MNKPRRLPIGFYWARLSKDHPWTVVQIEKVPAPDDKDSHQVCLTYGLPVTKRFPIDVYADIEGPLCTPTDKKLNLQNEVGSCVSIAMQDSDFWQDNALNQYTETEDGYHRWDKMIAEIAKKVLTVL